jgi:heme/copper-type cytochrome/quinol oxidase subunit 4
MIKSFAKEMPARIKGYVRENWGAPFIVGFMLLLMVAAASLSIGVADVANEVAIYAYFALVVGIVLQLTCFLKYNKRMVKGINESS